MTNIVMNGVATDLFEFFLTAGVDMNKAYGIYWSARKSNHSGKLPACLSYSSWEEFCDSDPNGAISFISPLKEVLQSFTERSDVESVSFDLVPSGTWVPRQQIRVTTPATLYREVERSAPQKLFNTGE